MRKRLAKRLASSVNESKKHLKNDHRRRKGNECSVGCSEWLAAARYIPGAKAKESGSPSDELRAKARTASLAQRNAICSYFHMRLSQQLGRYASRRLTRRLTRTLPWVGGAVALITIGSAIRRKGLLGGTLHTTLDFIPFVGGLKTLAEMARGRDFFPDKQAAGGPPVKN
jgi:hypothetical protein